MNTNKAYDGLMQRRDDRLGKNGIPGYQRELMRYMDDIQMVIARTPQGSPEFKELARKGKAVLDEMKRAGIQIEVR